MFREAGGGGAGSDEGGAGEAWEGSDAGGRGRRYGPMSNSEGHSCNDPYVAKVLSRGKETLHSDSKG